MSMLYVNVLIFTFIIVYCVNCAGMEGMQGHAAGGDRLQRLFALPRRRH